MNQPDNIKPFSSKSVVITGGTSGIGAATARAFAEKGAAVTFCGREPDLGKMVENEIRARGGVALFLPADVRSASEMKSFIAEATARYGGIDIAFNNAGINNPPNLAGDIPLSEYNDIMATNLNGVFYAMAAELAVMKEKGRGCIINTASILSEKTSGWMAAYSASKAAVAVLSQSAAEDYKRYGIRIYALSPGPVDTPMFQQALKDIAGDKNKYAGGLPRGKPPLSADAVATAVLELADEKSAPPSGTNLVLKP